MDQLEQLKDLLSEPKQVIKLTDFMAHASKNIVSELNEPKFSLQMQPNNDTFVSRIQKYEEAMQSMLTKKCFLVDGHKNSNQKY